MKHLQHAVALLTLVILPQQAQAYQINTTERGKRIRWADELLVLRLDPGFQSMLAEGAAPDALEMALDAWRGLPGVPDIQVKDGQPDEPGHHGNAPTNGVYLLQDWPYSSDKLAITVVTYELDTGRLLDADVLVNPQASFDLLQEGPDGADATDAAYAYDLAAVLTHEAGHVLGLGESEDDREATMWPYARMGETHQRTLSDDDEAGIIEAYKGPAPAIASGCSRASVMHGRAALPSWMLALTALLAFAALRGRRRALRRPATAAFGLGVLLFGGGVVDATPPDADAPTTAVTHLEGHAQHAGAVGDLADAARLQSLLGERGTARVGAIERVGTRARGGLLTTDYALRDGRGEHRFSLPGGELDGIGQIVGHGRVPAAGAELLVVDDPDSAGQHTRWAFHHEGVVWGGWLGDGPAIELR